MNTVDALLLRRLDKIGDVSVTKLLKYSFENGISNLEELADRGLTLSPIKRVPESLSKLLLNRNFHELRSAVLKDINEWSSKGIEVIPIGSVNYPHQLNALENPPPFLFCKGNLSLLTMTSSIAVVGTRQNTEKGQQIARKTVKEFSGHGFTIVSGLAQGIDTIAHRAALDFGTHTIAVLVDLINIAPAPNRPLADEILVKGGLLVAENTPGTPLIPGLFAKRDRIQAGLASGVFAIETSKNGGTMHAVNAAHQLNRPVFVPNAAAARYEDLSIAAIEGTQWLVSENKAVAYSKNSYVSIRQQLELIATKLNANIEHGDSGTLI